MITKIPTDISTSIMPPGCKNSPVCLIYAVKIHVDVTSPAHHQELEWQAESVRLATCDTFNDYFYRRIEVRQRMLMSCYPNIQDAGTQIKFMIKGMRGVEEYKQLTRDWISIPSKNLRALKAGAAVQYYAFGSDNSNAQSMPFTRYSTPQSTITHPTRPMIKTGSYHASLGARHNHDDRSCRDPKNPKVSNYQPPTPTGSTTTTFKNNRGPRRCTAKNAAQDDET